MAGAAVKQLIGLTFLLVGATSAATAPCAHRADSTDETEACSAADAPRARVAEAMIQTSGLSKEEQAGNQKNGKSTSDIGPLALRLTTLESEITSLQERLAVLQSEIMGEGGALLETGAIPKGAVDDVVALQKSNKQGVTIKERTATAEANVATLHSSLSTLENQVKGDPSASLLEVKASGSNLKDRIATLEKQVSAIRTRMSTLEHMVLG